MSKGTKQISATVPKPMKINSTVSLVINKIESASRIQDKTV